MLILSAHSIIVAKQQNKGSVYFTGDILAAPDRLELLCRQSKILSWGMTEYQEKGHFVRKTLSCSWCNGCYANGFQFDSHSADFRFFSLPFFRLCL